MSNQTGRQLVMGECKKCLCWSVNATGSAGLCRARAPKPIIIKQTSEIMDIVEPSRGPDDGCVYDFVPAEIE